MLKVKDIIEICNAKLLCGNTETICSNFCKDTRIINKGDVYIAIKGEKFDGNDFYLEALDKGASVCILERDVDVSDYSNKCILVVNNSLECLEKLAKYVRNNFKGKVIAITGSVGKTSTKDMIYSVVSKKYKTLKTLGNNNNNIGLPLTILRLKDEEVMILEMGMNHFNEIKYLSDIAKPDIAIITNIGTAHIGNLGSRENILKAKLEILSGLKNDGKLIVNNDNDMLHNYSLGKENVVTIGINNFSTYMADNIVYNDNSVSFKIDNYDYNVGISSAVFVYNSLMAYAVGKELGISLALIAQGISDFELTGNRLEIKKNEKGVTIIDDTYNASYDSVKASLAMLKSRKEKRKIVVLGDILELGSYSEKIHRDLAKIVMDNDIDVLVLVGDLMLYLFDELKMNNYSKKVFTFNKYNETYEFLDDLLKKDDVILLKGSHSINLTEVVNHLMK